MAATNISVIHADDHRLVRRGVVEILNTAEGISVVGECANGFEVLRFVKQHPVDVAVVDVSMPGPDLDGLIGNCRQARPKLQFVALTMHDNAALAQRTLSAGVIGYVHKDDAFDDLVRAVKLAFRQQQYVSRRVNLRETMQSPVVQVSQREQQVLRLIAEGATNKKIALSLGVQVKTVETYRTRVMKKLDVHSAAEMIRAAYEQGWL